MTDMLVRAACSASSNLSFGPRVALCASGFDFTLLFEEWIFSIVPAVLFLLAGAARITSLYKRRRIVQEQRLQNFKLVSSSMSLARAAMLTRLKTQLIICVLAAIQVALLVLWSRFSTIATPVSVPSASLDLFASLLMVPLSYWEHTTTAQPSTILTLYLLLECLLDMARVRTLWLLAEGHAIPILAIVSLCFKLVILLLESRKKTLYITTSEKPELSAEETSGVLRRTLFLWLNSLLLAGSRKHIPIEDLMLIDSSFDSRRLYERALKAWKASEDGARDGTLLLSIAKSQRWFLLAPIFPRCCMVALSCAQPLLLEQLVKFLEDTKVSSSSNGSYGWGLVGAYALVYLCLSVGRAHKLCCPNSNAY